MSRVVVRVSEDTRRPMGQALVTVAGLPRRLETCEFALRRHGCFANHLGPRGWQGAVCWLGSSQKTENKSHCLAYRKAGLNKKTGNC